MGRSLSGSGAMVPTHGRTVALSHQEEAYRNAKHGLG